MAGPYDINRALNPVVLRLHSFDEGKSSIRDTAVFLQMSSDYIYPSAYYTAHPGIGIESESDYIYGLDEEGYQTPIGFADFISSPELPSDAGIFDIGYVPAIDGLRIPITKENMPKQLYVQTRQNYNGGVLELGMYIANVFNRIGVAYFGGSNDWNADLIMTIDDPFALAPKLYMRVVGSTMGWGDYSFVSVYSQPITADLVRTEVTAKYSCAVNFRQENYQLGSSGYEYVTQVSYGYMDESAMRNEPEFSIQLYEDGLEKVFDVYDPPEFLNCYISNHNSGGVIQIGTRINNEFIVMGEHAMPESYDDALFTIPLTAVEGFSVKPFWANLKRAVEYKDGVDQQ